MNISKELVGATTTLLILEVLAKSPSYGYQIVKRINREADAVFSWQEGTVYPVLHRLEQDGHIRAKWQTAQNGRRRKYYYITPQGRGTLADCANQWYAFHHLIERLAEVSYA